MQSIEEFDKALNDRADLFIEAAKPYQSDIEKLAQAAIEAELPEHLALASLANVTKRVEALGNG